MNRPHVLLVADWTVDPDAVVGAARRRSQEQPGTTFGLLVPAWLHGIDWAGDPNASAPCACRQLTAIRELAAAAGLPVDVALVGDPDPATAIYDAVQDWHADEVLLCVRHHHLALRPFDLQHRARRLTGLPVRRVELPAPASEVRRHRVHRRTGHCTPEVAAAA